MYILIDLTNQSRKSFETKIDLLAYWRFRLFYERWSFTYKPLDFKYLNVTGNDTYAERNPYDREITNPVMRRFQVIDDEGRSQDIRTWEKEIEIVNAMDQFPQRKSDTRQPGFRREPAETGAKNPVRKGRYGAFTRQQLRDQMGMSQISHEDDLVGFTPIRDGTRVRPQASRHKDWGRKSRSWKSYTKNTSQWGRHSERAAETPIRKRIFEELDVEKLSLELIGSAG